jgi:alginate O-acetyltransferase complex protein AlgI
MQLIDFLPDITIKDVQGWFTYNPKAPLLFNTPLFLGLFVVFYGIYILTRNTFRLRLVYVIAFSLFFYYK